MGWARIWRSGGQGVASLAFMATALACSPAFDGNVYRRGDLAFRVGEKPSSWRQIEASDALIAYRNDAHDITVAVNGRCHADGDDVPLEALTQHLFMLFTEREIYQQDKRPMDGREALRTTMVAKLDGVKMGFVVYVLKKDQCVYDFLWIGPAQAVTAASRGQGASQGQASTAGSGDQVAEFDRYVGGFQTLGGRP